MVITKSYINVFPLLNSELFTFHVIDVIKYTLEPVSEDINNKLSNVILMRQSDKTVNMIFS